LKTNKQSEGELENDKRTLEKRKKVKEKLKLLGESNENSDRIITSIECYCRLVLESIKYSEHG